MFDRLSKSTQTLECAYQSDAKVGEPWGAKLPSVPRIHVGARCVEGPIEIWGIREYPVQLSYIPIPQNKSLFRRVSTFIVLLHVPLKEGILALLMPLNHHGSL